jgi:hypothetical protein
VLMGEAASSRDMQARRDAWTFYQRTRNCLAGWAPQWLAKGLAAGVRHSPRPICRRWTSTACSWSAPRWSRTRSSPRAWCCGSWTRSAPSWTTCACASASSKHRRTRPRRHPAPRSAGAGAGRAMGCCRHALGQLAAGQRRGAGPAGRAAQAGLPPRQRIPDRARRHAHHRSQGPRPALLEPGWCADAPGGTREQPLPDPQDADSGHSSGYGRQPFDHSGGERGGFQPASGARPSGGGLPGRQRPCAWRPDADASLLGAGSRRGVRLPGSGVAPWVRVMRWRGARRPTWPKKPA